MKEKTAQLVASTMPGTCSSRNRKKYDAIRLYQGRRWIDWLEKKTIRSLTLNPWLEASSWTNYLCETHRIQCCSHSLPKDKRWIRLFFFNCHSTERVNRTFDTFASPKWFRTNGVYPSHFSMSCKCEKDKHICTFNKTIVSKVWRIVCLRPVSALTAVNSVTLSGRFDRCPFQRVIKHSNWSWVYTRVERVNKPTRDVTRTRPSSLIFIFFSRFKISVRQKGFVSPLLSARLATNVFDCRVCAVAGPNSHAPTTRRQMALNKFWRAPWWLQTKDSASRLKQSFAQWTT